MGFITDNLLIYTAWFFDGMRAPESVRFERIRPTEILTKYRCIMSSGGIICGSWQITDTDCLICGSFCFALRSPHRSGYHGYMSAWERHTGITAPVLLTAKQTIERLTAKSRDNAFMVQMYCHGSLSDSGRFYADKMRDRCIMITGNLRGRSRAVMMYLVFRYRSWKSRI